MNATEFLKNYIDYLAIKMDMYEQSIYLYIIRHSVLIEEKNVVMGFKSKRKELGFGIGKENTSPSEGVIYRKFNSLASKGFIKILASESNGTRVMAILPEELPNIINLHTNEKETILEDIDFFIVTENREAIIIRKNYRYFYCEANLDKNNCAMEHVISRPEGNNSYKNIVIACRACNNIKGDTYVNQFLRSLYRKNIITQTEFETKLENLKKVSKS